MAPARTQSVNGRKPAKKPPPLKAPKPTPTVAALIAEVKKLRNDVDTVVWLHAELMFAWKQAAYLRAIQQAGPELARQLASGHVPQGSILNPPQQFS